MPAAEGTPSEMYQIMLKCWEYKPENRPKFEEIYRLVDQMHEASKQTAIM
jgi:tyrosine-protein kinase Fer